MTFHHHHHATPVVEEPQSPPTTPQLQQPDNWLYEIRQKGQTTACYVMVQNVQVRKVIAS